MEIVDSGSNQNKIAVRSLKWEAWKSLVSMYFTQGDDPDTIRLVTLAQEITKVHIHIPKEDQGKTKVIADLWLKWWEEHKDEY